MRVDELFYFRTESLPALEKTEDGNIPLVYGTTYNNGVVKYVQVYSEAQIFKPPLITVSYLGTAFVQVVPFTTSVVDKSNIIVLEPKDKNMTLEEMYFHAMQINRFSKFGFHYGRRMNMRQLRKLELLPFKNAFTKIDFATMLPNVVAEPRIEHNTHFKEFPLDQLFERIDKGDYHVSSDLGNGKVPLISCVTDNNGIAGYYDIPEDATYQKAITVTSDGSPLCAFYHPYEFNAQDNVMVCKPKSSFRLSTIFFIMLQFRRMMWRFSYGRKCYFHKFERIKIFLPIKDKQVDEDYIEKLCKSCYGWKEVEKFMQNKLS
jgi:hypothetical protein